MSIAIGSEIATKPRVEAAPNLDIYECFQFTTLEKGIVNFSKLKDLETFSIQVKKTYLCKRVFRDDGHKPGGKGERV